MASSSDRLSIGSLRARLPYMSQTALAEVLRLAANYSLPSCPGGTKRLRQDRNATCLQETPYGALHQSVSLPAVDGGEVCLDFQAPLPMLHVAASTSVSFQKFLLRVLAASPSTPQRPWRVMVYFDEVTPGNQLSSANRRKSQCVYWTIAEFGDTALVDEEAWFTCLVATSLQVKKVLGGMSCVIGAFLKMFWGQDIVEARWGGVSLPLQSNAPVRIFLEMGCILADTEALRQVSLHASEARRRAARGHARAMRHASAAARCSRPRDCSVMCGRGVVLFAATRLAPQLV